MSIFWSEIRILFLAEPSMSIQIWVSVTNYKKCKSTMTDEHNVYGFHVHVLFSIVIKFDD